MEKETTKNRKVKETSEEKKALMTEDAALGEIASDRIFEDDPELARELAEDRKIQERAREYKALQEERKRQKRKRIIIILIVVMVVILGITLGYKFYQKIQAEQNSEAQIRVSEGQELIYAEIELIVGNNISVSLVSENGEQPQEGSMEKMGGGSSYVSTGENAQYQIPVGTTVITKLGTSATFTSLSSGNIIAVALESGTDVIDKIWVVE